MTMSRQATLEAAKAEHTALTAWEGSGQTGPRPATPTLDAARAAHARPAPKRREPKGRAESANDVAGRAAFDAGRFDHPPTDAEIAAVLGLPVSSTYHVVRRLLAAGWLCVVADSPRRVWPADGHLPLPPLPAKPTKPAPARARKVWTVASAGGTVHAAHGRRTPDGLEYDTLCPANPGHLHRVPEAVTCKRCLKAALS
jgi:hypothetical protein